MHRGWAQLATVNEVHVAANHFTMLCAQTYSACAHRSSQWTLTWISINQTYPTYCSTPHPMDSMKNWCNLSENRWYIHKNPFCEKQFQINKNFKHTSELGPVYEMFGRTLKKYLGGGRNSEKYLVYSRVKIPHTPGHFIWGGCSRKWEKFLPTAQLLWCYLCACFFPAISSKVMSELGCIFA